MAADGLLPAGGFLALTGIGVLLSAAAVAAAVAPRSGAPRGGTSTVDSLTGGVAVVRRSPVLLYGVPADLAGDVGSGMGWCSA